MLPKCLVIAASDSGGEAGLQADLQTLSCFKVFSYTVISAITAQNKEKIFSINPVALNVFTEQIKSIIHKKFTFIKISVLPDKTFMEEIISSLKDKFIIYDPIIKSTSGTNFLKEEDINFMKSDFLKYVKLITPNIEEAKEIFKVDLENERDIIIALKSIYKQYKVKIYLKGGHHLEMPYRDYFCDGENVYRLDSQKIDLKVSHGSGCRFSACLLAHLSRGEKLLKAVFLAKSYIYHCLKNPVPISAKEFVLTTPYLGHFFYNEIKIQKLS